MPLSRRQLIKTGFAGQLLLSFGSLNADVVRAIHNNKSTEKSFLTNADRQLFAFLIPHYLGDAWSSEKSEDELSKMVDAIQEVILGLTLSVQAELRQLLDLLSVKPLRYALTGVYHLEKANASAAQAWLNGWQSSRFGLLRAAYLGLQQPIMGAWYGQADSWRDIGYPGPPPLIRS